MLFSSRVLFFASLRLRREIVGRYKKIEAPATLGQESIGKRGLLAPRCGRGFHLARGTDGDSKEGRAPNLF